MEPESAWSEAWSPGFNDPTVMGWIITVAYLWVAWSCRSVAAAPAEAGPAAVRVVSGARQISRSVSQSGSRIGGLPTSSIAPAERRYFNTLGWGLFILGINKQLDLQTAFFQMARATARSFEVQSLKLALLVGFTLVLGVFLLLVGGLLWIVARRLGTPARIATAGCAALLLFVLVRAVTFESLADDSLLQLVFFDSGLIEAAALAWIAFGVRLQRKRTGARGVGG